MNTPTVLCVDDDAQFTTVMREALSRHGCNVVTAATVLQAMTAIRETDFDLVILDVVLPDVDGYSFFELLRAEARNRTVPVLVVSGCASTEARDVAIESGAIGYLQKPFPLHELVTVVRRAIAQRRTREPLPKNAPLAGTRPRRARAS